MTQPQKIFSFLDVFGQWDPTLAFVMAGALLVHAIVYKFVRKKSTPLFSPVWHVPQKNEITRSLIFGSFLFGAGWALSGYCPGPAVTSLASFQTRPTLFVGSMLIGMFIFKVLDKKIHFRR
ncbi:hypothetical protein D3C86_1831390 [compost metagenome]